MCCVGGKNPSRVIYTLSKVKLELTLNLNGPLRATGCQLGHAPVMSMEKQKYKPDSESPPCPRPRGEGPESGFSLGVSVGATVQGAEYPP